MAESGATRPEAKTCRLAERGYSHEADSSSDDETGGWLRTRGGVCPSIGVRLAEAGIATWSVILVVGAIGIALVFALATIALARKGPVKEWLVRVLSMTSVGVALAVAAHAFATAVATWIRRGVPSDLHCLASLAVLVLPVVMFAMMFTGLLWGLVAAQCIALRGLALIPTATGDRHLAVTSRVEQTTAETLFKK